MIKVYAVRNKETGLFGNCRGGRGMKWGSLADAEFFPQYVAEEIVGCCMGEEVVDFTLQPVGESKVVQVVGYDEEAYYLNGKLAYSGHRPHIGDLLKSLGHEVEVKHADEDWDFQHENFPADLKDVVFDEDIDG